LAATIYYDADADLKALDGKTIAIIGYGSQGHAQAQNLRDSGLRVVVAQRPGGPNYDLAKKHGFEPLSVEEAVKQADVINILLPDELQGDVWKVWKLPEAMNPTGEGNYVILEADGRGHYVGCNLHIDVFERQVNDWYGEGDDMIFVDGEPFPSIHGTGTEDYFCMAYCPRTEYSAPYHGLILYSGTPEWPWAGKNSMYRYHIEDPIHFRKSIKVTIEHGHANKLSNDYSSTAYWYQLEPHKPFPPLPGVKLRLPRA